jgi:hypothetical protein
MNAHSSTRSMLAALLVVSRFDSETRAVGAAV